MLESLYGEDRGLSLWRSDFFAVHPDYQGRGLGTALHNVIAAELKKTNEKWVFGTSYYNVSRQGDFQVMSSDVMARLSLTVTILSWARM